MRPTRAVCALAIASVVFGGSLVRGQQPTFRTGVDVTTIDVSVVDNDGRPLADIKAGEFRVRVNGKDRRVVRADWIPLSRAIGITPPPPPPAGYTTNETGTRGRLILIAVDQPNIRFGGTQSLRASLDKFIDGLEPADRAAAVAIGQGGVSTGFTADRDAVKRAIATMAGTMRPPEEITIRRQMGVSEAFDIVQDNLVVLALVYARSCLNLPVGQTARLPPGTDPCLEEVKFAAQKIQISAAQEAQESLISLRSLLDSLKKIDAPKTLVVVTEGLVITDQPAIVELGTLAAAARVSLYVLRVDQTPDASNQSSPSPQALVGERQMRTNGAALVASVAKGEMFNVIGDGRAAVDRLEREVSGYYLLGVESDPTDSDGKAHPVSVQVSRPRTIVRARREFVAASDRATSAADPIRDAMRSPLLETGLGLLATALPVRDSDPSRVRLLLSAEVGSGYTAPQDVSVGYVITDSKDAVVVNKLAQGKLSVKGVDRAPLVFTTEESLPPGDYVWKLAVAEGARVGSVEHAIHTGPLSTLSARPESTSTAATAARPAPVARPAVSVPKAFRAEDALTPEVLRRFRETVPAGGRAPFDAGVVALQGGNATAAEPPLRESLQAGFAANSSVAPLVYLGVTFAMSGRDADAIGVWQVALTDGSAFPEIYDWLVEALLRTQDMAQARSILKEAVEKWPADARFTSRRAELLPEANR